MTINDIIVDLPVLTLDPSSSDCRLTISLEFPDIVSFATYHKPNRKDLFPDLFLRVTLRLSGMGFE